MMLHIFFCAAIISFTHAAYTMEQSATQNISQEQAASGKLSTQDRQILNHICELHKDKHNNPILERLIPACTDLIKHPESFVLYKCLANTTESEAKNKKIVNRHILI